MIIQKRHILPKGSMESIMAHIESEIRSAESKFPLWPEDPLHGAMIVAEEAGEAVKAMLDLHQGKETLQACESEYIQTAAMCIRQIDYLRQLAAEGYDKKF